MAQWHFLDKDGLGLSWKEGDADESTFDDGLAFLPGEEGFDSSAADKKAAELGDGVTAQFTGTPNWHARIEAEQAAAADAEKALSDAEKAAAEKASAEAAIDAMLNPPDPKQEERDAINARFDALLAAAPDRSADIEVLRAKELETV